MSKNRAAPSNDLRDPARRRPVLEDLRRIRRRRHFLVYAAVSDMRARQADSLPGAAWYLVGP